MAYTEENDALHIHSGDKPIRRKNVHQLEKEHFLERIEELENLVARLSLNIDLDENWRAQLTEQDIALETHCRIAYRARQAVKAHTDERARR